MERIFKVSHVFHSLIEGRQEGEPQRDKLEITLTWHETMFSSQTGVGIKRQQVIVCLMDREAQQCPLKQGDWIVANVSLMAYDNRSVPGKQSVSAYLNRYIQITDQIEL